jgi:hypothetical protein
LGVEPLPEELFEAAKTGFRKKEELRAQPYGSATLKRPARRQCRWRGGFTLRAKPTIGSVEVLVSEHAAKCAMAVLAASEEVDSSPVDSILENTNGAISITYGELQRKKEARPPSRVHTVLAVSTTIRNYIWRSSDHMIIRWKMIGTQIALASR